MARFTRGFSGRGGLERDPRLPPGQYDAGQTWPVLTAEPTPRLDTESWSFTVEGLVQTPTAWYAPRPAVPPATPTSVTCSPTNRPPPVSGTA